MRGLKTLDPTRYGPLTFVLDSQGNNLSKILNKGERTRLLSIIDDDGLLAIKVDIMACYYKVLP